MKKPIFRLICVGILAAMTGCATVNPVQLELEETTTLTDRGAYGQVPVTSLEQAHNALLTSYREGGDRGLVNTIRLADSIAERWPRHDYAASGSYLAGWAMLWVGVQPQALGSRTDHSTWRRYIESLMAASTFFERAGAAVDETDDFWVVQSAEPLAFMHQGFTEPEALHRFLLAQRLMRNSYRIEGDSELLAQAVRELEILTEQHPEWSRQHGAETLIQQLLAAMAMEAERRRRAEEIFGG